MPLFGNEIVKKRRPRSQRDFLEMFSRIYVQQQGTTCGFSGSAAWVVLSPIEQSIKRKIESVGKPLRDWDISINYGIKTG